MINFAPQKGKAFDKLPKKTLAKFDTQEYIVSTKFDGNQIFIVKEGGEVRFFTSDWKEFYLSNVAEHLGQYPFDFTVVGEFMHNCLGKLGDRSKSAKLTTYRTNFAKGLDNSPSDEKKANIVLFDLVLDNVGYEERLRRLFNMQLYSSNIRYICAKKMTGKQAMIASRGEVALGWEGVMLVEPSSTYHKGKRVNHVIKLKHRKTADLLCIDVEEGQGKCEGIGALVLQDSKGRIVRVGSGLDYNKDTRDGSQFIGKIIEIEYEQIMDTYIQPVFKCIREDKKEID